MDFKEFLKEDKGLNESAADDLFKTFFLGLIKILPTAAVSAGLKKLAKNVSKDYDALRINQYRTSIKRLGDHLIKANPKLSTVFKEIDEELKERQLSK